MVFYYIFFVFRLIPLENHLHLRCLEAQDQVVTVEADTEPPKSIAICIWNNETVHPQSVDIGDFRLFVSLDVLVLNQSILSTSITYKFKTSSSTTPFTPKNSRPWRYIARGLRGLVGLGVFPRKSLGLGYWKSSFLLGCLNLFEAYSLMYFDV